MAGDTIITVVGNLTGDPELRFTANGATPVANFTVASTPRTFDRSSGEWKDGEPLFLRCSIWREAAENVAESLTKGMRVIVQGRLTQRSYDTREGERRTVVELQVDEVGPSLRYATAQVTRNPRGGGYGGGQGSYNNQPDAAWSPPGTGPAYGGGQADQAGYGRPPAQAAGGGRGGPAQYGGPVAPAGGPPAQGGNYQSGPGEDPWTQPGVTGNAQDDPPF
ncbi:MAG: single-stranded DNA-binding protein [Bifidobacteriaceae bacterium]|jgi:single-strand DNA-binding protein|nr:single-stranded DNA-binding protein [Bifidobacteriaceae bacterium]